MTTRRALLVAVAVAPIAAFAQAPGRTHRIGVLSARSRPTRSNPDALFDAFTRGLLEHGYIEGKNLHIEWRFADGDLERLPAFAAELVKADVALIVTHTTPGTQALQRVTSTIPIVMTSISDPLGSGFVKSLARPGGNITGLSILSVDVSVKHVELLQTLFPAIKRVGVFVNPATTFHPAVLKNVETAARSRGLAVVPVRVANLEEIERGLQKAAQERVDAIIFAADSLFVLRRRQIGEAALKHRVPAIFLNRENVAAGGLISYGPNIAESYHRAATYVDKILKGAKPADLPIEQPSTFHLAVNTRTAKALGISVPRELLLRADEVIE